MKRLDPILYYLKPNCSWLFCLYFIMHLKMSAQVKQTSRIEIKAEQENLTYGIEPLNDNGLVLYLYKKSDTYDKIELLHLDTLLNRKSEGSIPIERNSEIILSCTAQKSIFLLIRKPCSLIGYLLIEFNFETGNYTSYPLIGSLPFIPNKLICSNNTALIIGKLNERDVVFLLSFSTKKLRVLAGLPIQASSLLDSKINDNGTFDLLLSGEDYIYILNYLQDGDLINHNKLRSENGLLFNAGRFATLKGKSLIIGIYGDSKEYSRGIFSILKTDDMTKISYKEFSEIENFYHYLGDKKLAKKKKAKAHSLQKKRISKASEQLIIQDLKTKKEEFLFISQAFQFISTSGKYLKSIKKWYEFSHVFCASFNKNGDINWAESFKTYNLASLKEEKTASLVNNKNYVGIFYSSQTHIYFNEIENGLLKDLQPKEVTGINIKYFPINNNTPLITYGNSNSNITDTYDILVESELWKPRITTWYGNNFLLSGFQTVSNESSLRSPIKIIYISKLTYR